MLNSKTKKAREKIVEAVKKELAELAVAIEAVEHNREVIIEIISPKLKAVIFAEPTDKTPMAHWHSAAENLCVVPGAWDSINTCHYRKATTTATSWEALVAALRVGFLAAADGSAFAGAVTTKP